MGDPLSRRVCTDCRVKKVRCDGVLPACGRCLKTRGAQCMYEGPNSSLPKLSAALQKGSACLSCRRKKKKCDGQRPFCNTCKTANKEGFCEYEDGYSYAQTLLQKTQELEERLNKYETAEPPAGRSAPDSPAAAADKEATFSGPTNSRDPASEPPIPWAVASMAHHNEHLEQFGVVEPLVTLFSSDTTVKDPQLRMLILLSGDKIRAQSFQHRAQICLNLMPMRSYAVMVGDTSAIFAHPLLVHMTHLIGFLFWQDREGKYDVGLEDLFLVTVDKALLEMSVKGEKSVDEINAAISACCGVAHYHLFRNRIEFAETYLRKAADFARELDLEATVAALRNAFSDDDMLSSGVFQDARNMPEERVAILAMMMFLDDSIALLENKAQILPPEYQKTLWSLRTKCPAVWKSNLTVMRVRATSVIRRARETVKEWKEVSEAVLPESQRATMAKDYWALLDEVTELDGALSSAVLRVSVGGDPLERQHVIALKCSLATAKAAKAALHLLLPAHGESRKMAIDTACQVVTISEQLEDSDFATVDVIMGAVWALASTVFLCEHLKMKDTKRPISSLLNNDAIFAAMTSMARSYMRLEMTYPVTNKTRALCDQPFDPELKARIEQVFTG